MVNICINVCLYKWIELITIGVNVQRNMKVNKKRKIRFLKMQKIYIFFFVQFTQNPNSIVKIS